MKQIAQGAEAKIYLEKGNIIKQRFPKSYRYPEIDKILIKRRTKAEAKILEKVSKMINVPKLIISKDPSNSQINVNNTSNKTDDYTDNSNGQTGNSMSHRDENKISMQFINGKKLSQHLDEFLFNKQKQIMKLIGESVAKLHQANIAHGDLTTSNMIYKSGKVYFIDFGLAFQNAKYEDKGVDIHLLKQALEAKHFKDWKVLFAEFEKSYRSLEPKEAQKVLERLNSIEKRGRYRN